MMNRDDCVCEKMNHDDSVCENQMAEYYYMNAKISRTEAIYRYYYKCGEPHLADKIYYRYRKSAEDTKHNVDPLLLCDERLLFCAAIQLAIIKIVIQKQHVLSFRR